MSRITEFQSRHPDVFLLDPADVPALTGYLRVRGWIDADEDVLSASRPGDGNMNCTVRVQTPRRTFILKQARPWVEKYDHIPAPWDRALVEARFYRRVASDAVLQRSMPRMLGLDEHSRVLLLDDLGQSPDLTTIYGGDTLTERELDALVDYLVALHAVRLTAADRSGFVNRDMRGLNHEYIFHLPLSPDNPVDLDGLTPGLGEAAAELTRDQPYVQTVTRLGEAYLADGEVLLHGDFFPGSWIRTSTGVAVIDPEFCFAGHASVDLGVFLAHLLMASQPRRSLDRVIRRYDHDRQGPEPWLDDALRLAGVEIMRRLIGVAQLPLSIGLEPKRALLQLSRRLVLEPALESLDG